jgi:hypothetical protein
MILNHFLPFFADTSVAPVAAGFGIVMILLWGIGLLGTLFVIWMLVDCLTSSMPTNEKILWALIIIFLHLLGAIIYFAVRRSGNSGAGFAT